jgi:hypothetical protein
MYAIYDRTFGGFPAKPNVYKPYMYGSTQLYLVCCIEFSRLGDPCRLSLYILRLIPKIVHRHTRAHLTNPGWTTQPQPTTMVI